MNIKGTISFQELIVQRPFIIFLSLYALAFFLGSFGMRGFNQTIGPMYDPFFYVKVFGLYDWLFYLFCYIAIGLANKKTSFTITLLHLNFIFLTIVIYEFPTYLGVFIFPLSIGAFILMIWNLVFVLKKRFRNNRI